MANMRHITLSAARSIDRLRCLGGRECGSQCGQFAAAHRSRCGRGRCVRTVHRLRLRDRRGTEASEIASGYTTGAHRTCPGHPSGRRCLVRTIDPCADCRDPKDNKYLELARTFGASTLVTGGEDLLMPDPGRGVRIVQPATYLSL